MSKLTVVAHIYANLEQIDLVRTELERLLPIARVEAGCLQYERCDNSDPAPSVALPDTSSMKYPRSANPTIFQEIYP